MNPIEGSTPVHGSGPVEPSKGSTSLEPPKTLQVEEKAAVNVPDASSVLKNVTSLTSKNGMRLLGETVKQGLL